MWFNTLSAAFVSRSSCAWLIEESWRALPGCLAGERDAVLSGFVRPGGFAEPDCSACANSIPELARARIAGKQLFTSNDTDTLTSVRSFTGGDVVPLDMDKFDQVIERIACEKPRPERKRS